MWIKVNNIEIYKQKIPSTKISVNLPQVFWNVLITILIEYINYFLCGNFRISKDSTTLKC